MNKKKICFVAQFPPPIHGLSKAVDTLYNSNLSKEFDFEKVDIADNKKFLRNLWLISRSKADLFYFTISQTKGGNLRDLIIFKVLEIQHKKCLIHLHGGYYRQLVENDLSNWQRKANYKAINKLAGAIVLGNSLKYIFQGMIDEDKIFVVPNCVDDEFVMSDEEFEHKLSEHNNCSIKHILYLSNFIKTKGYLEVLEMAKLEKKRVKNGEEKHFHFDFAGKFFEKKEEDFFWNFIRKNEIEDYITYYGVVSGSKKKELLKLCDIFVLLTRYPNEGQPISILEAMSNGMVIVTTNHAGIPDIVENEVNGIVVDKNSIDIEDIYRRIQSIAIKDVSIFNRIQILKKYRENMYIKSMNDIFECCIK